MNLFRNLLFWIALAVLGALLAQMLITHDHGFVLVRYGGYDYTTTLVRAIGIGLLVVLVLWLLWKLLSFPFRSWNRRRDRQSRARLGDGLDALHQGHYQRAEKLLAQATDDPPAEAPARVAAAHAAWARGDTTQARQLLAGFGERHPASRAIAEAELAIADGRPTDALVALDAPAAQPLPPRGLALRAEAFAGSGQAAQAYEMLGALRQQQALPAARLDEYETRWAAAALREAADANVLADRWETLSKRQRAEAAVVAAYADRGAALRWEEAATRSLEQALDTRWDEGLAERYGLLPLGRVEHRREVAERWLQAHPSSPALLLTLARLAQEQQQWAQAEDYLHRALAQGAGTEAWEALARGYEARGDEARARLCYRNALRSARGEPIEAFADRDLRQQIHDQAAGEDRDEHGLPRLRE
ncbi:heme biosynthesis HemY N-terminal domain-containing protein [Luteimonas sp. RD2P54]|uniref:Heme biosynthesis HemY N-terminal domain-containing protein n=1 Tax=Luteimonas endophytica TaxID=3042023 RepID=A0ABT6J904_9GAMM|nr:heme biosynthesis HemY N-terminal domain-containing protein [Luteimonas endophytica]MDH5823305.1 heme biosynthesis HemY N-terminal domain-containing protein [Luteimonas endophytica]